jgi:predicted NAD/FAD-dependent oxidoreductase
MSPCIAAMIAFDEPLGVTFDGAFVDDDALAWVAKDSSKPGRTTPHETWVLHATPTFSAGHLDGSPDAALPELLAAFARVTGRASPQPTFTSVHRWRYARSADARDVGERWSDEARLGLCGDWCAGDRVEGAFVSGRRLAARLVARG